MCVVLVLTPVLFCQAEILNQTDFENGAMAPWKTFVTPNGTLGESGWPEVVAFETAEAGNVGQALKFKVGQVRHDQDTKPEQGGGLVFQRKTEAGLLNLSVHVAVSYSSPKDARNLAGGLFEWLVDDEVIASHDMGPIQHEGILRHHFTAIHHVEAGLHLIRLRMTRPFTSQPGQQAPFQFVDVLVIQHALQP